jgi:hypothetical protein
MDDFTSVRISDRFSIVVFLLINDPYLLVPLSSLAVKVIAADALNKRLALALAFNPNLHGFLWDGKDFMDRALK